MVYAKRKNFKSVGNKGFTVIEMLVSMSVMVWLISMVLAYSKTSQSQAALARQAQQLVINLRRAQSMALGLTAKAGVTPCGYGIYFDAQGRPGNDYILFAEQPLNGNKGCPGNGRRDMNGSEDLETTRLDSGFEFTAPSSNSSVIYLSPNADTLFNPDSLSSSGGLDIFIEPTNNASRQIQIHVSPEGQITQLESQP